MSPCRALIGLALVAVLWPSPAEATLVLNEIVLHGATKIRLSTIRSRMRLRKGDTIDHGVIAEAKRRLELTQLFASVKVWLDMPKERAVQQMYLEAKAQPVDLQVTIEEKFSWFIFPNGSVGGGDMAVGGVYVEQNFVGTGIRIAAAGQYGQAVTYGFLAVSNPKLWTTPLSLQLSGIYRWERIRFYSAHRRVLEVPTVIGGGQGAFGWVPIPGLEVLFGVNYRRQWVREPTALDEAGAAEMPYNPTEGHLIVLLLALTYDTTVAPEGLQRGVRLTIKNEIADPLWGSDYGYGRVDFKLELYGYIFKTFPSLVLQTTIISPTSSGGVPVTEMLKAGGANLRGYQVAEFLGDTLVTLQLEEQFLIFRRFKLPLAKIELSLAGAIFADFGAVIDRHPGGVPSPTSSSIELSDFHIGVGGGLRILLPGVVIPAIKIDVAYGIDVEDYAIHFSVAAGLF